MLVEEPVNLLSYEADRSEEQVHAYYVITQEVEVDTADQKLCGYTGCAIFFQSLSFLNYSPTDKDYCNSTIYNILMILKFDWVPKRSIFYKNWVLKKSSFFYFCVLIVLISDKQNIMYI